MSNPFDKFDEPVATVKNPFDQFDSQPTDTMNWGEFDRRMQEKLKGTTPIDVPPEAQSTFAGYGAVSTAKAPTAEEKYNAIPQTSVKDISPERKQQIQGLKDFADTQGINASFGVPAKIVGEPIVSSLKTLAQGANELQQYNPLSIDFNPNVNTAKGDIARGLTDVALGGSGAVINSLPAMMGVNLASSAAKPAIDQSVKKLGGTEKQAELLNTVFDFALAGTAFGLPVVNGMATSKIAGLLAEAGINSNSDWKQLSDNDKQRIIGLAHNLGFFAGLGATAGMGKFKDAIKPEEPPVPPKVYGEDRQLPPHTEQSFNVDANGNVVATSQRPAEAFQTQTIAKKGDVIPMNAFEPLSATERAKLESDRAKAQGQQADELQKQIDADNQARATAKANFEQEIGRQISDAEFNDKIDAMKSYTPPEQLLTPQGKSEIVPSLLFDQNGKPIPSEPVPSARAPLSSTEISNTPFEGNPNENIPTKNLSPNAENVSPGGIIMPSVTGASERIQLENEAAKLGAEYQGPTTGKNGIVHIHEFKITDPNNPAVNANISLKPGEDLASAIKRKTDEYAAKVEPTAPIEKQIVPPETEGGTQSLSKSEEVVPPEVEREVSQRIREGKTIPAETFRKYPSLKAKYQKQVGNLFPAVQRASCGECATKSILSMYGKDTNIGISTETGVEEKPMIRELNKRGIATDEEKNVPFENIKPKSIVYYPKQDHWITVEKIQGDKILVNNSDFQEPRWISKDIFKKDWQNKNGDGYVINTKNTTAPSQKENAPVNKEEQNRKSFTSEDIELKPNETKDIKEIAIWSDGKIYRSQYGKNGIFNHSDLAIKNIPQNRLNDIIPGFINDKGEFVDSQKYTLYDKMQTEKLSTQKENASNTPEVASKPTDAELKADGLPLFDKPKPEDNQGNIFSAAAPIALQGIGQQLINKYVTDEDTKKRLSQLLTLVTCACTNDSLAIAGNTGIDNPSNNKANLCFFIFSPLRIISFYCTKFLTVRQFTQGQVQYCNFRKLQYCKPCYFVTPLF